MADNPVIAPADAALAAPAAAVASAPPAMIADVAPATAPTGADGAAAAPHPATTPSLLETAGKQPSTAEPSIADAATKPSGDGAAADAAAAAKAVEPKAADPKTADPGPVEPKPAVPVTAVPIDYSAIELPDTIKPEGERYSAFTAILGEHRIPAEAGTKLARLAGEFRSELAKELADHQVKTFLDMRADKAKQVMADPEFGGAGFVTSSQAIARMRDRFASSAAPGSERYNREMGELNDFMRATGAGDWPAFWRILHNVAAVYDEPAPPPAQPARPPADHGKPPGGFKTIMYDHPRSAANGRG